MIMMNMTNTSVDNSLRYIILEDGIMYDNDDYGLFGAVLYDVVNKKIVVTKYGHGGDMKERSSSIDLKDIQDNKKEIMEEMISVMLDETPITQDYVLENIALCASEKNPTAIPVNVVRGRKFKGFGYLIYGVYCISRFGKRTRRADFLSAITGKTFVTRKEIARILLSSTKVRMNVLCALSSVSCLKSHRGCAKI